MTCCRDFLSQLKPTFFDNGPASNIISDKLNDEYTSFYFGDVIKSKLLREFDNGSLVVLE